MSIIGVTLVLFLLGIVGWLVINGTKLEDYFKENVEVRAYLKNDLSAKDSLAMIQELTAKPYLTNYNYVDKETAGQYMLAQGDSFNKVLDFNPLPDAIYFHVKKEYVTVDSLEKISNDMKLSPYFTGTQYPKAVVTNLNKNFQRISIGLLIIALIIAVSVIFLIDNTIRLAMFSNRFLIKTMQMVGATRWFIAKPLNIRAIINGAISAVIASILVYLMITSAQNYWPDLAILRDNKMLALLFLILLVLGISITLFSTYRSVLKYLRMKLDELY
jgi:cell division transport system permease protein